MYDFIVGMITGIIIGLVVGRIKALGKSICEEEYEMDFESYKNKVLKCKLFTENYDGIRVDTT